MQSVGKICSQAADGETEGASERNLQEHAVSRMYEDHYHWWSVGWPSGQVRLTASASGVQIPVRPVVTEVPVVLAGCCCWLLAGIGNCLE